MNIYFQFFKLDASQLNKQNGVLFSEELTDDYEIWTLQCPDDVSVFIIKILVDLNSTNIISLLLIILFLY